MRGDDEGLTPASVRRSCGLVVEEVQVTDPTQEVLQSLKEKETPVQAMRKGPSQEEDVWMRQTCSWLRDDRKDWFRVAQLKAAKCKHVLSFNKAESKEHVDKLVLAGKLLAASAVLITEGRASRCSSPGLSVCNTSWRRRTSDW